MGFIHVINCLVLMLGPSVVFYQSTKLKELNTFVPCAYAAGFNILTQLFKTMLVATFVTPSEDGGGLTIIQALDVIGAYNALNFRHIVRGIQNPSVRILCVGLGWSISHSVLTLLLPTAIGAWQYEFSSSNLINAVTANVDLISIMSFVTLVWIYSRNDISRPQSNVVLGLALILSILPAILNLYVDNLGWTTVLMVKSGVAVAAAGTAYTMFQTYMVNKNK